jgi:site-specific recombinase XerD
MAARLREFASGTDAGKQELIRAAEAEELYVEECEKAIFARHEAAGRPDDGWIFPGSNGDHITDGLTKGQHRKGLDDSGVKDFVPYVLRHTALTNLGEKAGGNVFALASIAGHSSISVTQRYIHPQADTINRIFTSRFLVGTKLGTPKKLPARARRKKSR